jgi:hypothetical protein
VAERTAWCLVLRVTHRTAFTPRSQVSQWTSSCLENCIKRLTALNKPFKYVVTCVIMQKNGEARTRAHTHIHTQTRTHTHAHTRTHTRAHAHTHARVCHSAGGGGGEVAVWAGWRAGEWPWVGVRYSTGTHTRTHTHAYTRAAAGAGLHTAASCWWDATTDGSRTVRWENKSMYCICTVFGLAV